jgi:hypothetical protein
MLSTEVAERLPVDVGSDSAGGFHLFARVPFLPAVPCVSRLKAVVVGRVHYYQQYEQTTAGDYR